MVRKHDRIIHFEAAIQRMRFDKLSRVYSYLNDITNYTECYDGNISIDQMFKHYDDLKLPAVAYDYDNAEDWGLSIDRLQYINIYKSPKEVIKINKSDQSTMNADFNKGDGYYLVIRGVKKLEEK